MTTFKIVIIIIATPTSNVWAVQEKKTEQIRKIKRLERLKFIQAY